MGFVVAGSTGRSTSLQAASDRPLPPPIPEIPTASLPDLAPAPSPASLKALGLAVILVLLLLGLGAGATLAIMHWNRKPQPEPVVVQQPDSRTDQAEEEKRKLEEDRQRFEDEKNRYEEQKQRAEYERLMKQGAAALAEHKFEEADKVYGAALKLYPTDVAAAQGQGAARAGLQGLAKEKQTEEERRTELERLLEQGKEALASKRYAAAVLAFEAALRLRSADATAGKGLEEARKALAADQEEKKKLAAYQKHLDRGQAAMVAGLYADAVIEFAAAQRLLPNDGAAVQGQRAAEKRLAEVQDQDKRRTDFTRLMDQGNAAMRGQRYEEGVQAFREASLLFPSDRSAPQALREAERVRNEARKAFAQMMERGETAMRFGRYEEAARQFAEATKLMPNDEKAARARRQAEKMVNDLAAAQQAYFRFMTQGQMAMRNFRYAEAVQAFGEALRLLPNDLDAARLLREAKLAFDEDVKRRAEFDRQMQLGAAAMKQRQYTEATKAFQEALRLVPDDPRVVASIRQARYSLAMAVGHEALKGQRYAEAMKAFEDALKEVPDDPAAKTAWLQAKALNRKP
jgi:tetratricopeptide (TPR) repeat protein